MDNNKSSIQPFKPVEILLRKSVARYFSAKNRGRTLESYGLVYIAFLKFHKLVDKLFQDFENGLIEQGILNQPRKTLYLKESEMKIECIEAEVPKTIEVADINTSSLCVFEVSKMGVGDFSFIGNYKK